MARKEPLYPHVPKGSVPVNDKAERKKKLLAILNEAIEDERKAAVDYRNMAVGAVNLGKGFVEPKVQAWAEIFEQIALDEDGHHNTLVMLYNRLLKSPE